MADPGTLHADPYASRTGGPWRLVPRPDPVVRGGPGDGPLDAGELETFDRDGFLSFPSLFAPEEVEGILEEVRGIVAAADPGDESVVREPSDRTVRSVFRVHERGERISRVIADPRLADRARQILGGDVHIHQSRVNFKPALVGKEFFWHSDFETWHVEDGMPRPRAVSVSLALTPNTEFNGPLMVIPGSHRRYLRCPGTTPEDHYRASLRRQEYGVPGEEPLRELAEAGGIAAPRGPAGSATFFECNLMHGSAGNLSPWPRTNLFVVYNSVENRVTTPFGGRPPRPEFLAERTIAPLPRSSS